MISPIPQYKGAWRVGQLQLYNSFETQHAHAAIYIYIHIKYSLTCGLNCIVKSMHMV